MGNSKDKDRKLGEFLREVSNWDWDMFCKAENDTKYTSNEAIIFSLIRACAMEKMDAIKLALNRIDGKLKTPIQIELPKVFFVYPYAKIPKTIKKSGVIKVQPVISKEVAVVAEEEVDLPSLSLRETLTHMAESPREVPQFVMKFAQDTQLWLNGQGSEPEQKPKVKSVVCAHLLKLAQERNVDALSEVFDQIDGKLVETIQVLGEDMFIPNYSLQAPEGAYINADGVLQVEATVIQDAWAEKLTKGVLK